MFISCGQDAASVFESGWSHLTADLDEETKVLTMSLYIPSLLVGRWGEARITQVNESLGNLLVAMGVERNGLWLKQSQNLPWHWTSALVSAIANDTFAASHQNLARGLPRSEL
jgi:hydroxymethylglutaryl-CoA reductase